MSELVIDRTGQKEQLQSIFGAFEKVTVRETSKAAELEKKVNDFLDGILYRKEYMRETINDLEDIMPKLEAFTWSLSNPTEEFLADMRKIVGLMHSLHSLLVKNYVLVSRYFATHKIGKAELTEFKSTIDDFKELAADLHDVVFVLPQDEDFQNANKRLESLC